MNVEDRALARGVLEKLDGDRIVLHLPHTDYRLHLVVDGDVGDAAVGKRVRGTIEGRALRVHASTGGGRFIEPVMGEPRIVAGTVLAVDDARRILVDVAVPMWLATENGQDFGVIHVGGLVNCYVESGTTFTPAG